MPTVGLHIGRIRRGKEEWRGKGFSLERTSSEWFKRK